MTLAKILSMFNALFIVGFKMSAPSLLAILLTVVVLGLMTKVAQEINVFNIAFQIKILIGFFLLIISLPLIIPIIERYLRTFEKGITSLMATM